MQLVPPVDLLAPSICIVCESQPDEGTQVVDTLYNLTTGVASPLNGRKYVCERCVRQFGKLFGLESGTEVQEAKWELELKNREVAQIRQRVDEFAQGLADAVNHPSFTEANTTFDKVFAPPTEPVVIESETNKAKDQGISSTVGSK